MEIPDVVTVAITVVLVLLGTGVAIFGIRQLIGSARIRHQCSARARGVVLEMVERPVGGVVGRLLGQGRRKDDQVDVVAANEAIAAKKRAYQEKQRRLAEQREREEAATWHVVVEWAPEDDAPGDDTPGGSPSASTPPATPARLEGRRGHRAHSFRPGQAVVVMYDPQDLSRAYLEREVPPTSFGLIMLGCGVALVVIGIVCWFAFPALNEMAPF